ncbi:MAG: glycosyltransferase family 4 protein [Terrimicrobiaceae bacterium]
MRILTVSHYFDSNRAGVELIAAKIRQQLQSHGHSVRWVAAAAKTAITCSTPSDKDCIAIPMWDGIRTATDLAWPIPSPLAVFKISLEIKAAELVHLHEPFYPACQMALYLACCHHKPVVITQHIADMPVAGQCRKVAVDIANALLTRPAHHFANRIVFYSARSRDYFANSSQGKNVMIYNGCNSSVFHPLPEIAQLGLRESLKLPLNRPVILFVGRFIEKKGLKLLRDVCQARQDLDFVFIGHGPLDPAAWVLPNVTVLPPKNHKELSQYYQSADCLILPAVGEGFPLVVQEAMCSGLPCLVSQEIADGCPALADCFITTGQAGRRTLEVLRNHVHKPPNEIIRKTLAQRAAKLWSWEECGNQYDSLFRETLQKHSCR